MKKRVAINLLNFSDDKIAGAAVFAKNLLRGWFNSQVDLPEIVIYQSNSIDIVPLFDLPSLPNITFKRVRVNHFWSRILYEQLIMPIDLTRFNIYFSPTPVMPFLAKLINKRLKLVVTIHDMIPFFVANKYGRLRSTYVKSISINSAKYADHIITVSENSKNDIVALSAVEPTKITVVYNFIPYIKPVKKVSYENFFLSISTIEPGKNIENTVHGFKVFLQNNHEHYKFYWIGKIGWGYTKSYLEQFIADSGLENSFLLLGYVDDETKTDLLTRCKALVYLSHYEGFGLPVLEGLYFNKPTVVLNNSSLPEVIGKAGILCDKGDADDIAAALSKITVELDEFIKEIPNQLKKFDEATQINKFLKVIGADQ